MVFEEATPLPFHTWLRDNAMIFFKHGGEREQYWSGNPLAHRAIEKYAILSTINAHTRKTTNNNLQEEIFILPRLLLFYNQPLSRETKLCTAFHVTEWMHLKTTWISAKNGRLPMLSAPPRVNIKRPRTKIIALSGKNHWHDLIDKDGSEIFGIFEYAIVHKVPQ